jgi:hypothetical protein
MTAMSEEAATYSAVEALRGGRRAEIRALTPDDRADLIAAVGRTGAESFHRRFFGVRHEFTEREIAFFLNIDSIDHLALVAVVEEAGDRRSSAAGVTSSSSPGRPRWRSRSATSTRDKASGRR